ncbi:hypothetical protein [Autumnicola musiva]|uniref:DUF4175 family protein n=1 Tax=Autumnicola musiva TaxID=3075589 RepID=A0ABU3D1F8_9FLAO|nr:hypothetical protein [Zunongwangia sp. F117]MDT0675373.1 hypothetical protein [Zunongwangia sp. F117]
MPDMMEKMNNFKILKKKLEGFIRKFYLNRLLRGVILFVAVGLLYFLLTLGIEYYFWLSNTGRAILFWLFVAVEFFLLVKLIGIPFLKLLKLSKGLDEVEASRLIGLHFPEVNDKLLNVLQLQNDKNQSDLLLASIDQKAKNLQPVPFTAAVNFRGNVKYLKFAAFPVIIIAALFFTGNSSFFSESYNRVSHYNKSYEPPAPFAFILQNDSLKVNENKDFTLKIETLGEVIPAEVSVIYNGDKYLMKNVEPGKFTYVFKNLEENRSFRLESNEVISGSYVLKVNRVPKLLNFAMLLDYPSYTGKKDERISGTGNAHIPEGTTVSWNLETAQTSTINFNISDSTISINNSGNTFTYSRPVYANLNYEIGTSNNEVSNYEKLSYKLQVQKDEFPRIDVKQKTDSVNNQTRYFKGTVSDDYGLSKLLLIYYQEGEKDQMNKIPLEISRGAMDQFLFTFPGNLQFERGKNYEYYFQVFDNDAVNGAKYSKSEVFSYREKSVQELTEDNLQQQNISIDQMNNSLEDMGNNERELEEISRIQKENQNLDYNQRKKLNNFIKRQKEQNELMRNYSEKLKNSFKNPDKNKEDSGAEELQRRIDRNEERLKENEALLEELEKLAEKINREELGEKLEKMSRKSKSDKRNLEQLLELTKRYYVEEKKQKLARDLENLSEKQEDLSKEEKSNVDDQKELSEEFEDFQKQLNELEKENQNMKSPKDLGREEVDEESIKKDQQEAEDNLEKGETIKAGEKQKNAAEKMKEMSRQMKMKSAQQQGEQLDADIETLRQILDNLLSFSFEQEDLLKQFRELDQKNPVYASKLKKQNVLREHFEHIDDSLYSLAFRNQMINEEITENLTDIEFDINKALERLSENEIPQGVASQQYVVTRSNNLAYLLSRILSSMQQMANPKMGKGSPGEETQLMDIIKKQGKLQEQMQKGMQERNEGERKKGDGSGEGLNGDLYEIYKEQQKLRQQLERLMKEKETGENGQAVKEKMEELEEELLDKKFDPKNLEKMINLQHELMKFQDAKLQQGEDNSRTSETNQKEYSNEEAEELSRAKDYFNATEILNRQVLPLRQIYKVKVKEYFDGGED